MAKDIIVTPASGLIDFQNDSVSGATITFTATDDLEIAATGDISIGDTSSDVFIGDGISNVDIVFEQDGSIRGTTGTTITLGDSNTTLQTGTNLSLNSNDITNVNTITASSTITGQKFIFTDYGGEVIRMNDTSFSNAPVHDIMYTGFQTALGDYLSLKVAGNSTTGHGIIGITDNGIYFGKTDIEFGNAQMSNSATAPFDSSNYAYINSSGLNVSGNITLTGTVDGADVAAMNTKLSGIDNNATNTADPAITTNGSTPSLASGIDAGEIRSLIGAGTSSTTGTVTSVGAGNGLNFTSITTTGNVALGTPSTSSNSTSNAVTSTSHTHAISYAFNALTNKTSGTGDYVTTGDIGSGENSGGVALTTNDGYGNANVTFNHRNGVPDNTSSTQSAYRIEAATDNNTASMSFEMGNSTVQDTEVSLTQWMSATLTDVTIVPNLNVSNGLDVTGNITVTGTVDGADVAAMNTKLAGIDVNATNTADPAITTNGSAPSLASGIDAAEVRSLIGAGTSSLTLGTTSTTALAGNTFIPTVNNNTITLSAGNSGISIDADPSFTLNQNSNETITISHADTSSISNIDNSGGNVIQDLTFDGFGHVTAQTSVNLDGRYYTESELQTFFNRGYISSQSASSLAVGWYTIATNAGDRASARFSLWDTSSGNHQTIHFYATHKYGTDESNDINVISYSCYTASDQPIERIRIKELSTYDGAVLQVYISETTNIVAVALHDNVNSQGWVLKDWIPDATDPGGVSTASNSTNGTTSAYSSFTQSTLVNLKDTIGDGGMLTTGKLYAGGQTTQYQVLTTNDFTNSFTASRALISNASGNVAASGVTTTELNILDGATVTTAELNKLSGFTGVVADLNYAKDLRATGVTTTEFDKLDGLTATTTQLNYVNGVTSDIQTQLNGRVTTANTRLDLTSHSLVNFTQTSDYNKRSGYQTFMRGTSQNASVVGTPVAANYWYYNVMAKRDTAGGTAATLMNYDNGDFYVGLTADSNTNLTWRRAYLDTDFSTNSSAPNSATTTASRSYLVQRNNSDNTELVVNVPWVNTQYSTATSSTLGLVKIGYSENGQNYPVELNNGQMFVTVPWTDNNDNTTYSLVAQQTGGNNTNPNLLLDASTGTDDTIQLVGSGATSVTRNNDGQITFSSTDTDERGVTSVGAGNGLDFTTFTTTGNVVLGTPGTITGSSSNAVTSTSHTHALTLGSSDITGALGYTPYQESTALTTTTISASHSTSDGISITATDNVPNSSFNAMKIDYNVSGATALTANRGHYGLYIDVDSSATGGTTSNEHRVWGIYSDVRVTGDSDLVYGNYALARADNFSTGTITHLRGHYGLANANHNAGTVTNSTGVYGYAQNLSDTTGLTSNITGVEGVAFAESITTNTGASTYNGGKFLVQIADGQTANISQAHGVYSEIQIDNGIGNPTISNAYVYRAEFDENDSDDTPTITNSYLFYGNYSGSEAGTNKYGIYITGADVESRFIGTLRVNNSFNVNGSEVLDSSRNLTNVQANASIINDGTFDAARIPTATSTTKGAIELLSDTVQTVTSNAVTTVANRTYGIQLNSAGQAVVNVPWENDLTATEILNLLKTVDGANSGLDADTLDSIHAGGFLRSNTDDFYTSGTLQFNNGTTVNIENGAAFNFNRNQGTAPFTVDSSTVVSNLNADYLDDQQGSYYLDYNNLTNKPTIPTNNNQLTNGAGYLPASLSAGSGSFDIAVEDNYWRWRMGGTNDPAGIRLDAYDTTVWQVTRAGAMTAASVDVSGNSDANQFRINGTTVVDANSDTAFRNVIGTGYVSTNNTDSSRSKFRLYSNSATYAIGMQSGITFGGLNDWAMTFQMNDESDRGFWWGDTTHTTAQGAMSLTTNGRLTVADTIRVGFGETDTTDPGTAYALSTNGDVSVTGDIDASANITANRIIVGPSSGGTVGLTTNDGAGNANVTFNHVAGVPDQAGQAARIEVNTDATSTTGTIDFEVSSADVAAGVSATLTNGLRIRHNSLEMPRRLSHFGDDDTYIQFDTDRVRIFAGGLNFLDITESTTDTVEFKTGNVTITNDLTVNGDLNVTGSSLLTGDLVAQQIFTDILNANNITAGQINASSIIADTISANAIEATFIRANAITANQMAANSITAQELQISTSGTGAGIFMDGANNRIVISDS